MESSLNQAHLIDPHTPAVVLQLPVGLPCATDDCSRITTYAIVEEQESRQWIMTPGCWEHGYVEASVYGESQEQESIKRFLLGRIGVTDLGRIVVIDACPTSEVPDYRPWDPLEVYSSIEEYQDLHLDDKAWRVLYRDGEHQEKILYVVWSYDVCSFDLYLGNQSEEEAGHKYVSGG